MSIFDENTKDLEGFITRKIKIISASAQQNGLRFAVQLIISRILDNTLNYLYYHRLPVYNNRFLFFSTPDYSDNARALYDYMVSKNMDKTYDLIWAVADSKKLKQLRKAGIKCVKQNAIFPSSGMHRLWYYGKTAKYIFHTHSHPFGLERKEGQKVVGLWHGGMGFKGPMGALYECNDDYILTSGSGNASLEYSTLFHGCSKDILLPFGFPRDDLLFKEKYIEQFDSLDGIKILWMPTFRESNDKSFSSPTIYSETDLPIVYTKDDVLHLNGFLKSINVHLFVTNHPLRKKGTQINLDTSNIHTLNTRALEESGIQLYEIFNHFSALISDYSSVTFDYLYLDRPIAYTLDDFEEYKISRGFAMENPLDYMPGYHVYTYDDLTKFISDVVNGNDGFKEERGRVRRLVGLAEGGKASEMLLDFLGIK